MVITTIIMSTACSDIIRAKELEERAETEKDAKIASELREEAFRLDKRAHKIGRIGDVISFLGL